MQVRKNIKLLDCHQYHIYLFLYILVSTGYSLPKKVYLFLLFKNYDVKPYVVNRLLFLRSSSK